MLGVANMWSVTLRACLLSRPVDWLIDFAEMFSQQRRYALFDPWFYEYDPATMPKPWSCTGQKFQNQAQEPELHHCEDCMNCPNVELTGLAALSRGPVE